MLVICRGQFSVLFCDHCLRRSEHRLEVRNIIKKPRASTILWVGRLFVPSSILCVYALLRAALT